MKVSVLSPEKEIFAGDISYIKVPGIAGQFEVLENHAPIVAALGEGKVKIRKTNGDKMEFPIRKGFIEVLNNQISLLIQGIEQGQE